MAKIQNIVNFFHDIRIKAKPRNVQRKLKFNNNFINSAIFLFLFVLNRRSKQLKGISKDSSSPFFLDIDGKNPIFRTIYDYLSNGVKGTIKKDVLLAILSDVSVRFVFF